MEPSFDQIEKVGRIISVAPQADDPVVSFTGAPDRDLFRLTLIRVNASNGKPYERTLLLDRYGQRVLERAELEERIECVVEAVREDMSIGEALRRYFPMARFGDESPDSATTFAEALTAYVRSWAEANIVPRERAG